LSVRQYLGRNEFLKRQWHRALGVSNALAWKVFVARSRSDPLSEGMARTFSEAREGFLSGPEAAACDGIEALRAEMLASNDEITFTNFGAVTAGFVKAPEEEEAGVRTVEAVSSICASASQSPAQGLFLFRLLRNVKPAGCLELGTCLGVSAMYLGTALQMNGNGRLLTVEGGGALADIAARNTERLGLDCVEVRHGRVEDCLAECLASIGQVDFAFIDANHDGEATVRYFGEVASLLGDGAVVLFDDIRWSKDMAEAWKTLKASPRATRTYDLGTKGILVYHPGSVRPKHYRVAVKGASVF